jgi:hypothetical protein
MPNLDSHPCPGGCGHHVPRKHLSCKTCWLRLPVELREEIQESYNQRDHDLGLRHARAITRAADWYHSHPRGRAGT